MNLRVDSLKVFSTNLLGWCYEGDKSYENAEWAWAGGFKIPKTNTQTLVFFYKIVNGHDPSYLEYLLPLTVASVQGGSFGLLINQLNHANPHGKIL